MPPKLQIDSALSAALPSLPPGILLGTQSPPRLLSHIPTPPTPLRVSAIRWASDHARLVSAMCPGGLVVLARYVPTLPALSHALLEPHLLVGLAAKGRLVAKENVDDKLRPADLKVVPELSAGLVPVRAHVCVPPLYVPVAGNTLQIAGEQKLAGFLSSAVVVLPPFASVDANQYVVTHIADDTALSKAISCAPVETSHQGAPLFKRCDPIDLDILLPLAAAPSDAHEQSTHDASLVASVSGGIHVEAFVMQDATLGDLLAAVRQDLTRSFHARVQLVSEEDDSHEDDQDVVADAQTNHTIGKEVVRPMPVRIVARPKQDNARIPMSDYLVDGETVEDDVITRFVEILSWSDEDIEEYTLLQTEQIARGGDAQMTNSDTAPLGSTDPSQMKALDVAAAAPMTLAQSAIIAAFAMAILAIIIKELL